MLVKWSFMIDRRGRRSEFFAFAQNDIRALAVKLALEHCTLSVWITQHGSFSCYSVSVVVCLVCYCGR